MDDECRCDAGRYHVDSSNSSLIKTSFNFVKYFKSLAISKQNIPYFGNDTFLSEGLTELEKISVHLSQLRSVELVVFNGLTDLKLLSLSDEIREILSDTFEKLSRLEYLYLRNKKIEKLSIYVFSRLISLIGLDLCMNKLQYLYPNTVWDKIPSYFQ